MKKRQVTFQECSESGSRNITKVVFVVGLITGQLRPSRKDPPVRRQHLRCGFCRRRQGAGKGREGEGREGGEPENEMML